MRQVVYRDSQPWPFPSSLMLGFRAICDGGSEPFTSDDELEDVRWFDRDELRDAGEWASDGAGVLLPPPVSIAWKLITDWVAEA